MKMKRKSVLSLMLAFVLVLLVVPSQQAFASSSSAICAYEFDDFKDGGKDYSWTNSEGTSLIEWNSVTTTLTLKNMTIVRENYKDKELCGIRFDCDATIVLIGKNSIEVKDSNNDIFGAINMEGHTLTINGSKDDNYMGSLELTTEKTTKDNLVIRNASRLTVENVRHLGITAGGSEDLSTYGVWRNGSDFTVTVKNSCIEINAKDGDDFTNAFYAGSESKRTTVSLTNSSFNFQNDDKKLIRGKGTFIVDGNDKEDDWQKKQYGDTSNGKITYYYKNEKNEWANEETNPTVPSSGTQPVINYTVPKRDGYVFTGWNTKEDGTGIACANGDTSPVHLLALNLELYAQYTPDEYTITYTDGVDGEEIFEDQVYPNKHYGDTTPAFVDDEGNAVNPTRAGYSFDGWTPEISSTVTGDATYTATWKQDEYTVTYTDGVDGEEIFEDQVYPNKHYGDTTPAFIDDEGNAVDPIRDGYDFIGWTPGLKQTVTGTITYVAQWEIVPYTITYTDGVDGEEIFEDQVYPNKYYNDATPVFVDDEGNAVDPTRTGYTFEGWKLAMVTSGDNAIIPWSSTVTGNATYIAQWKAIPYTITYTDGVDGEEIFADQVYSNKHYGDTTPVFVDDEGNAVDPTRAGYSFDGWTPEISSTVTGDATYTATWKQNESRPNETEPNETEPNETRPNETEPNETEPNETRPNETEPNETRPNETEPNETKPNETKPNETKQDQSVATGDNSPIAIAIALLIVSGTVLVMICLRKKILE